MKRLALLVVLLTGGVLLYATRDFPEWGDPASPASRHVSPHYITRAYEETAVPNMVTAVLADYRNLDTFLETTVIFTAGIAIILILRGPLAMEGRRLFVRRPGRVRADESGRPFRLRPLSRDLIIVTACRLLFPPLQLFALYVLAHGHHSPGGGFQGGVILGAAYVLLAIAFDLRTALQQFSPALQIGLFTAGVLLYGGIGVLCLVLGGNFFDYSALSTVLPVGPVEARSLGILGVETGVALTVMAVIFSIYVDLASHGSHVQGL